MKRVFWELLLDFYLLHLCKLGLILDRLGLYLVLQSEVLRGRAFIEFSISTLFRGVLFRREDLFSGRQLL
jgi:hypothetical protein